MPVAYVSIAEAKRQLNAPQLTDEEVDRKVQLASGQVRKYLNKWAGVLVPIVTASVANPTVIETTSAHGLTTGDTVVLSGITGSTSTPDLSGEQVVTVLTSTTFSVPVDVTVEGTGGTVTLPWTEETASAEAQLATLLWVGFYHVYRGDGDMKAFQDTYAAMVRLLEGSRDPALA